MAPVVIYGRGALGGVAEGPALISRRTITGWGGVDIRTGSRVVRLATEGHAVVGVETDRVRFRAERGVILGAGDFTNDPELKARYMGAREAQVQAVNVTATGDGQKMALELGANYYAASATEALARLTGPDPATDSTPETVVNYENLRN